jgi:hypothetical protein
LAAAIQLVLGERLPHAESQALWQRTRETLLPARAYSTTLSRLLFDEDNLKKRIFESSAVPMFDQNLLEHLAAIEWVRTTDCAYVSVLDSALLYVNFLREIYKQKLVLQEFGTRQV